MQPKKGGPEVYEKSPAGDCAGDVWKKDVRMDGMNSGSGGFEPVRDHLGDLAHGDAF